VLLEDDVPLPEEDEAGEDGDVLPEGEVPPPEEGVGETGEVCEEGGVPLPEEEEEEALISKIVLPKKSPLWPLSTLYT
jgi:hypothetical protein